LSRLALWQECRLHVSWEILVVFILLGSAVLSFALEKISAAETSFLVFASLMLLSLLPYESALPKADQLLNVFSTDAPITIAAMFILSAALEKCGALEILANWLGRLVKLGFYPVMFLMMFAVAMISAFVNNTPVVVIFVPVMLSLARKLQVPASKMLIPLSYASIFGGVCTLVGTSTNILASGILQDNGREPINMFELSWVGLPLLFVGAAYTVLLGSRLLPRRESLTALLSEEERREYLTTAFIHKGSQVAGKSPRDAGMLRGRGVRVLEIIRNDVAVPGDPRDSVLEEGDRLVLALRPQGFAETRSLEGLNLGAEENLGLETIAAHEGAILEGVIGPRSNLQGHSIGEINFRQRYRMIVLAIHRRGVNLRDQFDRVPLEFGDTLLMMGTDEARLELQKSDDILLLDHTPTPSTTRRKKTPAVLGTLTAMVIAVSLGLAPIFAASIIACAILFVLGALRLKEGLNAVEWNILVLIYGMLGLGLAMESTGASRLLAEQLVNLVTAAEKWGLPSDWKPYLMLAGLYLLTNFLTEILSNNATIVLMAPIALGLGDILGVDPRAYIIACCIAASASFSTPIGYQTNTYVYGVGNYKFTDFAKIGIPLNLLYFVTSIIVIPYVWSF